MKHAKYTCSHPLFQWSSDGDWHDAPKNVVKPVVFFFESPLWIKPSREKIAEYRLSRRIVEELGGSMNLREFEIAGKNPVLTFADTRAILRAIRADNPTAKVIEYWNGKGCYTMSVGVDMEPGRKR